MNTANLDRNATRMLIALGFTPKNLGYYYLRDALIMIAEDPSLLQLITKSLYPDLATRFHTKSSDIERAIRFTIREWYLTKTPRARLQAAEVGEITVPEDFPTNLSLIKLLSAPLRNFHTWPLSPFHREYDAPLY